MNKLERRIHGVRPSLFQVSPLTAFICWSYGVINILIGLAMFTFYDPQVPISIADIFSYQVWGVIFFLMGASTIYGLLSNRWMFTRNTQLMGILVKSIWALALIARCFTAPTQTILITMIWLFFASIQVAVYIYFIPRGFDHD